ncbi:MAG: NADH:ubiquinone reductase (Na(+)-transporting) subunit B [Candidatus Marinimicrobia bacterium]|jgi:Na+-transporting NADH:ubiquinone oxidoreductase subunit B|nr:NADH:ubiquinone reductase (Na(+)-transporting) subunit B [Candidatus Neomarinimicrobiota bacterium]MBO69838.1 NADH:ubiquinone reductase (Na(+)-transporting) subunit B [Candidatus Neomarinimicrobiota bacterium]MEC8703285.1 NADH:ubiquinone reductase (Na(+)-transporting) subunit B [Candidatus Neomarinimicrobiota bacterium]MEC8705453.1 NADH:ubiquinone reductase (Na(+)-transporting) subunit B [Candidatus Neomarinimicrobiota bacterium]|tara:strand:- start:1531 stop:2706 length:1176 start_codon:yes stop_codon:yes gene_type:complete
MLRFLYNTLNKAKPHFEKGGKFERLYPVFEATDTILFSTDEITESGPHIRDSIDTKRIMILVVISLLPLYVFGALNVGFQNALALGIERTGWQNFWVGFGNILPIIAVTFASGAFWELLFAVVRKHPVSEGFLVTCALIPLTMPPNIPLWQIAIATSFGIVIGKEIFGGVGMNIFNPALMARVFIFFTYPTKISGDKVWVAGPDGYSGATALAVPASELNQQATQLLENVTQFDFSWWNLFWGWVPGSIGETNKFMILLAAIFLIYIKIINWRIVAGAVIGLVSTAVLTNLFSPFSTNTMFTIPPHYHLVMGSFLFGTVFMATEPVTGCHTNQGRWIYGIIFGALTVIIRSVNPAYPEGVMLSILFVNAFAALIDWFVIQSNVKRRAARHA